MDPQEFLRMRGIGVGKKLVGDATSGDVRAGKTFSNAQGNDKQGTLPVRSLVAQTITPGVNNIIKQAGIYDGDIAIEGDPDLVAANIVSGKNIFGVAGSYSGKKFASGTATSVSGFRIEVTGLSFQPSVIFVGDGAAFGMVYISSYSTTKYHRLTTTNSYTLTGTTSYVNNGGFAFENLPSNSTYNWQAYE